MIQRIQSIFLLIAAALYGLGSFLVPDWDFGKKELWLLYNENYLSIWYLIMAALSLGVIFIFKNRSLQLRLIRITIFLSLVLLGFFVYWFLNLPGEASFSELLSKKGIGVIIPLVSIVFLRMAYRAIKRDDDLVKSVDRIR